MIMFPLFYFNLFSFSFHIPDIKMGLKKERKKTKEKKDPFGLGAWQWRAAGGQCIGIE
jgi:hypothetical protein